MSSVRLVKAQPAHITSEILGNTILEPAVPLSKMFVYFRDLPGGYARPLNSKRVAKLDEEFDLKALGIILLSMRNDGTYAIIDGQHRVEVAKRHGMSALDGYVYIDLTVEEEARLYRQFGDYLKQSARDRWFAGLTEKQPEVIAINGILATLGLRVVNDPKKPYGIAAVESLLRIYRQQGSKILFDTLETLIDAFGRNDRLGFNGSALVGMAMFLERFGSSPTYRRSKFIARLNRLGSVGLEQRAKSVLSLERTSTSAAYGKALLAIHDSMTNIETNKLGAWKERAFNEEARKNMTRTLATKALPAAIKQRQDAATVKAQEVECPVCQAKRGTHCVGTERYHMRRAHYAAAQRRLLYGDKAS
jgi:hypothetical protein